MPDDETRLAEILEAIDAIEQIASGGRESIDQSAVHGYALIGCFTVIGEAVNRLTSELKALHSEVDWREVVRFRNFMVHQYMHIDLNRVWRIIEHDVPVLKTQVQEILEELHQQAADQSGDGS